MKHSKKRERLKMNFFFPVVFNPAPKYSEKNRLHSLIMLYQLHLFISEYTGAARGWIEILLNNNFNFSLSLSIRKFIIKFSNTKINLRKTSAKNKRRQDQKKINNLKLRALGFLFHKERRALPAPAWTQRPLCLLKPQLAPEYIYQL